MGVVYKITPSLNWITPLFTKQGGNLLIPSEQYKCEVDWVELALSGKRKNKNRPFFVPCFFAKKPTVKHHFCVGSDEERVGEAWGSSGAPVDHHLLHFNHGGPHPRRGRTHKNNAGAAPPHFWVAPPRKGVGPARLRRREVLI